MMNGQNDFLEELERLDAFLDGTEPGERPLDVLRERGIEMPEADALDDAALHARLWEVIREMAEIGMVLDSTDHLSDRELYEWLRSDALAQEEFLGSGICHLSPVGDGDDADIYLRYYADDEDRALWAEDLDGPLPPKEKPPFDRDRFLPGR